MRAFFIGIVLALFSTAAQADDVLIVGSYGNATVSIKAELEAVGHTVTEVSSLPADISDIEQIWDVRINDAISTADQEAYDTFLQNSGYLYLAGENSSFATRNNSISAFTSTLGGGAVSVGGYPSNAQDGNDSYFSSDTSVDFIAAATITNTDGTGRVLAADANGNPTGMIWIGNAGDFSSEYNGTVVVIADINWTQSNYYDANNEQFLEELIAGVVAGTVEGTIDESGTGTDVGGAPAEPTLVSSEDGDPIIVTTDTAGGTTTVTVESFAASETDTQQTLVKETDTIVTTVTNRETCTTPTTVNTYSDSTTETVNGTESCATQEISSSTTTTTTDTYVGAIDQQATAQDIVNTQIRNLDFSGLQGVKQSHTYENGMSGDTTGFTLGGTLPITDNGLIIGGGFAQLNTTMDGANTSSSETTAFQGSVARAVGGGTGELKVTRAMTDYSWTREIGPYSNAGSSSVTDTSISGTYRHALNENITPIVGYTIGRRESDAWQETGFLFSQRSAEASEETYRYGTVGVEAEFEMLNLNAVRHTDGVTVVGAGLGSSTEKFDWGVGVERTITDLGENTGVKAGIKIRF